MGRPKKTEKQLTSVELELMNIIWRTPSCTVRDVVEALPKERALAYTSVATMMKILEDKGVLTIKKQEKTHLFFPNLSRERYEMMSLRHMTDKVFQGNPSTLILRLLDDAELTPEELKLIRKTIEARVRR